MQIFTATLSVLALCGGMASASDLSFGYFDTDGSGALDKEEFNPETSAPAAFRLDELRDSDEFWEKLMNHEPDEFFEIFDSNGNGEITENGNYKTHHYKLRTQFLSVFFFFTYFAKTD